MGIRYAAQSRLDDLFALLSAESAEELQRALVLGVPAASEAEHTMPLAHFRRVHGSDPVSAAETAMLLVTDTRWQVASHRLIEAIAATDIVRDDELDLLAYTFVAGGRQVYWKCPGEWFAGSSIVIDFDGDGTDPVESVNPADLDVDDDDRPVVVSREIPPGVRRWAAERVVRLDPSGWPRVLNRAREVGGVDGAALVRGLLDAIDVLADGARRAVRMAALRWGRADVRLAALELLAEEDAELSRVIAARDPNNKVRRWASRSADRGDAASREELQAALF